MVWLIQNQLFMEGKSMTVSRLLHTAFVLWWLYWQHFALHLIAEVVIHNFGFCCPVTSERLCCSLLVIILLRVIPSGVNIYFFHIYQSFSLFVYVLSSVLNYVLKCSDTRLLLLCCSTLYTGNFSVTGDNQVRYVHFIGSPHLLKLFIS